MNRRDFLKTSAAATAALVSSPLQAAAGTEKPSIRRYQEIGKTGLKMSDISMGSVRFTAADERTLNQYAAQYSEEYCRTGCNDCEPACPEGVEIATTFRYGMYFRDYGMEKTAMESYAALRNKAENCSNCEDESCAGSCPYGLSIKTLLHDAHKTLSFRA